MGITKPFSWNAQHRDIIFNSILASVQNCKKIFFDDINSLRDSCISFAFVRVKSDDGQVLKKTIPENTGNDSDFECNSCASTMILDVRYGSCQLC